MKSPGGKNDKQSKKTSVYRLERFPGICFVGRGFARRWLADRVGAQRTG
jgi:hypothetical protein